jgi:hypothetical protein
MIARCPNLFVIGAPKCGTSALCGYLATHPHIFMCDPKEPHYFNQDFDRRYAESLDFYLSLFNSAGPEHLWRGEGSTAYLYSEVALARIIEFDPRARFVAAVRNPVEMIQALHAQRVRDFTEDVMDFESALKLEARRRQGARIPAACPDHKLLAYRAFCRVGQQLRRACSVLPPAQLHVIVYDDLVANPGQVYEDVLRFLNLEFDGRAEFPRVNPRRHFRFGRLERGLRTIKAARERHALPGGLGLHALVNRFNLVSASRAPRPEVLDDLRAFFADDVALLSTLLQRDLSHWLKA